MATVKFDMRDPETKAVVEGWADNTEYTILTGAGPARSIAQVVDTAVEEEPIEEPGEEVVPPPGPAAVKKAMGATY